MESITNKVILITGASTGIGGFTARYLSKFKPKLVLVARSPSKLKQVQRQCEEAGVGKGNVAVVIADLGKHEDVKRVIPEAIGAFGRLDVLVNNAAAKILNDLEHTSSEGFDRTMAVNIKAPFFLSQAAIPHLKKTKGSIINISSISAQRVMTFVSTYCISKAALEHFTRVLALELAPNGVRVNAITLGYTLTDTQEEMRKFFGTPKSDGLDAEHNQRAAPLGGLCNMEDVAKVVGFLISDLSAAMTGTCVPVDRGTLVVCPFLPADMQKLDPNMGDTNALATEVMLKQLAALAAAQNNP